MHPVREDGPGFVRARPFAGAAAPLDDPHRTATSRRASPQTIEGTHNAASGKRQADAAPGEAGAEANVMWKPGSGLASIAVAWALLVGGVALAPRATAQGVQVALSPADSMVAPGSEFVLRITVTAAGSLFNAYDAVVAFDPGAVTFLPASPLTLQEGAYMKNACGNTFHRFIAAPDSLLLNHSLLCNQLALTGPGVVYKLRFRAAITPQTTTVHFRLMQFYNAGFFVNPTVPTDAVVHIGVVSAAGTPPAQSATRVWAAPNPCNPGTLLHLEPSLAGLQSVVVRDVAGRSVRLLERGIFGATARSLAWDGRGAQGRRLPSGVYLVQLDTPAGHAVQRVVLLQ